jgi:hypothetical protein
MHCLLTSTTELHERHQALFSLQNDATLELHELRLEATGTHSDLFKK